MEKGVRRTEGYGKKGEATKKLTFKKAAEILVQNEQDLRTGRERNPGRKLKTGS